jgi:hypothetical protein
MLDCCLMSKAGSNEHRAQSTTGTTQNALNEYQWDLRPYSVSQESRQLVAAGSEVATQALENNQLCRDTSLALLELRHAVLNIFYETLEKLDLDAATLIQVFDERPSNVRELMKGDPRDNYGGDSSLSGSTSSLLAT